MSVKTGLIAHEKKLSMYTQRQWQFLQMAGLLKLRWTGRQLCSYGCTARSQLCLKTATHLPFMLLLINFAAILYPATFLIHFCSIKSCLPLSPHHSPICLACKLMLPCQWKLQFLNSSLVWVTCNWFLWIQSQKSLELTCTIAVDGVKCSTWAGLPINHQWPWACSFI